MVRTLLFLAVLSASLVMAAGGLEAAERRVALVLGNGTYATLPALKNPVSDARSLVGTLERLGFEVVSGFDLSKDQTQETMARFAKIVRGADMALFFYAGHGLQVSGRNYLLPIDAVLEDETSLDFEAVPLDFVLRQLSRETKVRLVFLDACRDNPLTAGSKRLATAGTGLAEVQFEDGGEGTLIAFATSPNQVAFDGGGMHSPFTTALLTHLADENVQLTTVMTRVTGDVFKSTDGKQRPWVNSSLIGEISLNPVAERNMLVVGTEPGGVEGPSQQRSAQQPAVSADQLALNTLRAQIPKLGSDAAILFNQGVDFGEPELDGKSIAELIQGKPRFAPVEGLDKTVWDRQCTSCHAWTQSTLCDQAKTYDVNDVLVMRLPHPLGTRFKVALARWAHEGCQ